MAALDQRRRLVSLTPKSRGLATRISPHIEAAYEGVENELGEEFIERCYTVLDSVLTALSTDQKNTLVAD